MFYFHKTVNALKQKIYYQRLLCEIMLFYLHKSQRHISKNYIIRYFYSKTMLFLSYNCHNFIKRIQITRQFLHYKMLFTSCKSQSLYYKKYQTLLRFIIMLKYHNFVKMLNCELASKISFKTLQNYLRIIFSQIYKCYHFNFDWFVYNYSRV